MRKRIQYSLVVVLLSLAVTGAARSQAAAQLSSAADVYRQDEEGATYDRRLGPPVPLKETISSFKLPVVSMLPEAIPAAVMKPMIAVVIDDMGLDRKKSARTVKNLDAAVTLSYLPYARQVREQVAAAQAQGHEIMLHMPWEANSPKADPGPNHLKVSMSKETVLKAVRVNLEAFTGYAGVNNHMGSKFSRHRPGLEVVMAELKKRGLFYLDSKTIPNSVAEKLGREYGVPVTHRDVFLDHEEDPLMVGSSLQEVEAVARRKGSAIAIGHPKDMTLAALESWLPTLEKKGFQLVPLSDVLAYRQKLRDEHIARLEPAPK